MAAMKTMKEIQKENWEAFEAMKHEASKWIEPENLNQLLKEFNQFTGPFAFPFHDYEKTHHWLMVEFVHWLIQKMFNLKP